MVILITGTEGNFCDYECHLAHILFSLTYSLYPCVFYLTFYQLLYYLHIKYVQKFQSLFLASFRFVFTQSRGWNFAARNFFHYLSTLQGNFESVRFLAPGVINKDDHDGEPGVSSFAFPLSFATSASRRWYRPCEFRIEIQNCKRNDRERLRADIERSRRGCCA